MDIEREQEQEGETSSRGYSQTEDARCTAVPKWCDVLPATKRQQALVAADRQ